MGDLFSWIWRNIGILITWLYKNRKWLFSGIGVAIVTAVLTQTITSINQYRHEQRRYPAATEERLNYLVGKWTGEFIQENREGKLVTTQVTANLINEGRIINGYTKFISFNERQNHLRLFNGIFDGRILKIEYESKQARIFQKGSIVGEMTPHGDTINGKFVGYSPELKRIISGEVTVSKVNTN